MVAADLHIKLWSSTPVAQILSPNNQWWGIYNSRHREKHSDVWAWPITLCCRWPCFVYSSCSWISLFICVVFSSDSSVNAKPVSRLLIWIFLWRTNQYESVCVWVYREKRVAEDFWSNRWVLLLSVTKKNSNYLPRFNYCPASFGMTQTISNSYNQEALILPDGI